MQKIRKSLLLLIFISLFTVALVACSSDDGESSDESLEGDSDSNSGEATDGKDWSGETIKVQLIGDFDMEDSTDPITGETTKGLSTIKEKFESQHKGASVEFIIMPWEGYTEKTQAMITSGEADVYQMPGIADFASQGVLEPIKPYMEEDDEFDTDKFLDKQVEGWKVIGKGDEELSIFGLPFLADARFIAYDKQLFDEWGVEYLSEYPTMDEVAEKAKKMTGKNPESGKENFGIWYRGDWDSAFTAVNTAEGQNGQWGIGFAWDNIEFEFNSEEMVNGVEWLLDMKEYAPNGLTSNQGNEKWLTKENNIAIMMNQGTGDTVMPAYAQDLGERIGIAQMFKNEEGMGGMFAGSPITMAKDSEHKDLAWEWMKFATSETMQKYVFEEANAMPTIKALTNWESYEETKNLMDPTIEALSTPWTPRYPWASSQPRFILTSEIEAAMTGERSAKEALEKAQKESMDWLENRN